MCDSGLRGPVKRLLVNMENYYAGYGVTWERMALIKARGVAGDRELLYEFNQRLQPFTFENSFGLISWMRSRL